MGHGLSRHTTSGLWMIAAAYQPQHVWQSVQRLLSRRRKVEEVVVDKMSRQLSTIWYHLHINTTQTTRAASRSACIGSSM